MPAANATVDTDPSIEKPPIAPDTLVENWVAFGATGLVALVLFLIAFNAGPLWRDEVNTFNIAQSASLKEIWNNLPFESFPPLYILILRAWCGLGLGSSDAGIRMLGLLIGLLFLGLVWLLGKRVCGGPPIFTLALLGSLPSAMFVLTSNRAYGLTLCLLILAFTTVWRVMESPTPVRVLLAALACLLFAHCLYYNVVFLGSILFGACLVVLRRREWRALRALIGIGLLSAMSLAIYLPVIRNASAYVFMFQVSPFAFGLLWSRLNGALALQSSAQPPAAGGMEVRIWLALIALALGVALYLQLRRPRGQSGAGGTLALPPTTAAARADLALFAIISMLCGTVGHIGFLLRLRYPTQSWYYVTIFALCAICIDAILGARWPAWRPWGLMRVVLMGFMIALGWSGVWEEAHARRSNVDLIASALSKGAVPGDLILVYSPWEGITFDRYFHGPAHWESVPPLASHKLHRLDLMREMLGRTNAMAPVLTQATETLKKGGAVWVVGHVSILANGRSAAQPVPVQPLPPGKWLGFYLSEWSYQLTTHLAATSTTTQTLEIPLPGPVNALEKLPVFRFAGFEPDSRK